MKLYQSAMTPSSQRVSIFLAELGVDIEREEINVREGENLTERYKAMSVNGKVPVLELDDGNFICESIAICRYIDELYDHPVALFGYDAKQKAMVEMWGRVVEWSGIIPAFQAFRNITGTFSDRENCIESWGYESKLRVERFLPQLDERLAHSEYVALDRFSIVDISAYIFVMFVESRLDIAVLATYSNIARWFNLLKQRPTFSQ
jgi:glutathione S-transferase